MRTTLSTRTTTARAAMAMAAAASVLGLSACSGTAGSESGADVEDVVEEEAAADEPFDGPYDTEFYEDVDDYTGEEVTLSADVNEVITPEAFTIAGTDDTTVEALLVVGATGDAELASETTVKVTGTVEEAFVLTDVEDELGVDLDDALFTEWEDEPYVVADDVEVLENVD
ncbi:hypothetical protein DQ244_12035 [Blastococcus sp. TBT05-19]|uniref:hypothetical protein n=1 Tax=Blastococcus sp. TBT05-19 TaxID=2250581 RepID=UPI000DEA4222|nr:hypothetical protein [Blastococcus sp. TBT05-19]RBY90192.1 hypothetical protein DQ244_12035 [Blastococcus sp. TBT05-19]